MRVLLIVADALRADHLGCYGYGRPTSPFLDGLANNGSRFTSFFAPNIPTEPAHTTIFSGEHAARHGVMVHKEPSATPRPDTSWLPGILKSRGVRTVAFDNLADSKAWFGQGWTEYHNLRHGKFLLTAADINAELVPWLARNAKGPWFGFVHYWDAHSPYLPPEPDIGAVTTRVTLATVLTTGWTAGGPSRAIPSPTAGRSATTSPSVTSTS